MKLNKLVWSIFLIFTLNLVSAQTLTIKNTSSTASNCAADGTLAVEVEVDPGSSTIIGIYYSIESTIPGASRSETQNIGDPKNYTFVGLPSGNHKLVVKAILSSTQELKQEKAFSIAGDYVQMEPAIYEYVPSLISCDRTGVAFVRIINGKENPTITITQYTGSGLTNPLGRTPTKVVNIDAKTNDYYFYDLPSGEYEFKILDACYTTYKTFTVEKIYLSNYISYSDLWVKPNNTNCYVYEITPKINDLGSVQNSKNIKEYYSSILTYSFSIPGYTSQTKKLNIKDTIPESIMPNMIFADGTLDVFSPCGDRLIRFAQIKGDYKLINSSIYPSSVAPFSCNEMSAHVTSLCVGQKFRVLQNGVLIQDWKTITSTYCNFSVSTSFKDYYNKNFTIEVTTPCGGIYSKDLKLEPPTTLLQFPRVTYNCDPRNTFNFLASILPLNLGMICLPATYTLTNTVTGEIFSIEVPTKGVDYPLNNIPNGRYEVELKGSDGYVAKLFQEFDKPTPVIIPFSFDDCTEGFGNMMIKYITPGTRIQLISSPPGTSYYYDRYATSETHTIDPDNGLPGKDGDYTFRITDTCGATTDIFIPLNHTYKVKEFELTPGVENCNGLLINTSGGITLGNIDLPAYFRVINAPAGYLIPTSNLQAGTPILLTLPGVYTIGITSGSGSTCALRTFDIKYAGAGVRFDLDKSLAYVCPGASDSEGRIYVKALRGKDPYTFYVSKKGDGGEQVATNPAKYLVKNNTGDFTTSNFTKGETYDVTIIDACGSVVVQQYKIGNLNEVRLAYAEKPVVCEGDVIQFRAMALPDPTYKWYKPNSSTVFSTDQSPSINSATLGDGGIYKVDITTSLCQLQTVTMEVPVVVQPPPTLTRTGGAGNQNICDGTTINEIVYTWGGSAIDVSITGLGSLYYTKDLVAKTLTIKGAIPSNATYKIETIGGCSTISESGAIIVKTQPSASVFNSSLVNQSICLGNSLTEFYFTPTGSANDLSVVGLPAGVTGVFSSGRLTISGTPTVDGTFVYTVTASTTDPLNHCPVAEYKGTIIVGNQDLLTLTSGTNNQTICIGSGNITDIVYTWGGTARDVSITGVDPTKYTKDMIAKTITIHGPFSTVINYTITTIGCTSVSLSGSITINPSPTMPSLSSQYVCNGGIPTIIVSNTTNGCTYRLHSNSTDNTILSSALSSSEGSSVSLTAPSAIVVSTNYYVSVVNQFGCESSNRSLVNVQVYDVPSAPVLSGSIVCNGGDAIIKVISSLASINYTVYDASLGGNTITGPILGNGGILELNCGSIIGTSKTFFVEAENSNGCIQNGGRVEITLNNYIQSMVYPDIRVLACPTSSINLSQFLDQIDITSLKWTTSIGNPSGINTNGIITDVSKLQAGHTYKYLYEIENPCPPKQHAVLYLKIPSKPVNADRGEVRVCYVNAANIQLNQIMGLSGQGAWTCDHPNANTYLSVSTDPTFMGAVVLDGLGIWNDASIPLVNGEKRLKISYTPDPGNCFSGNTFYMNIVITDSIIP